MTKLVEFDGKKMLVVSAETLREFLSDMKSNRIREDEKLLTNKEFCARVGISRVTLWQWCKTGEMTPTIVAGKKFYRLCDLKRLYK